MTGPAGGAFAAELAAFSACVFVERRFVAVAETVRDLAVYHPLPEPLRRAAVKRQAEFLAGRVCAQEAIAQLTGERPYYIPLREDRSPGWPPGLVGAITHTASYAAALVAPAGVYQGLGLDCEVQLRAEQLSLQRYICRPGELENLQQAHPDWPPEHLLTLVFSAKESLYKCLYARVQRFFGFQAARLTDFDPLARTWTLRLEQSLTPTLRQTCTWTGHFARQQELLLTFLLDRQPENRLSASFPGEENP